MPSYRRSALLLLLFIAAAAFGCTDLRHGIVTLASPEYEPAPKGERIEAVFDENDLRRPKIEIALVEVGRGFVQPTDLQLVPGRPELMLVLEKRGVGRWLDLSDGKTGTFLEVEVLDDSEQGLLGLAFHPGYLENGRLYLNSTVRSGGREVTRIAEWSVPPGADLRTTRPAERRVILEVEQPYQNHNAGQLAFGPDGYLYIGLGDGGWADDPHDHGQDTSTLLGDMLRIDVDKKDPGKEYAIPPDNPFVGREGYRPEIWAVGLRNPWRYSFDPLGRLIVADVGQDDYEEIDVVERGQNLGWNVREARHCFKPKRMCKAEGMTEPIFEYGRSDGGSVTGGYVALGRHVPALEGKYVFGDFLSGRLWALELPKRIERGMPLLGAYALGRWPILPSTFARDAEGRLYVADYPDGLVFRIDPPRR